MLPGGGDLPETKMIELDVTMLVENLKAAPVTETILPENYRRMRMTLVAIERLTSGLANWDAFTIEEIDQLYAFYCQNEETKKQRDLEHEIVETIELAETIKSAKPVRGVCDVVFI